MNEKGSDRRTLKTRRAICEALAELLAEKELHKVTVQEIADKADINRVTFYKHYLDVYDLYDKIEQETLVELGLLVLKLDEVQSKEFCKDFVDYIEDNKAVFKMMFSPNSTQSMRDKFTKLVEGLFLKVESEQLNARLDDDVLLYETCYRAQGAIAVISKWVLGGFSESRDFLVKVLSELDSNTGKLILKK